MRADFLGLARKTSLHAVTDEQAPTSWASSPGVRRSMLSNRAADTRPEVALRSHLHRRGLRFRKNFSPGVRGVRTRADVAFPAAKVAVYVDGCFWHRCPLHGTEPKANSTYWKPKLDANVERDRRVDRYLAEANWLVMRVWEHEDPEEAAARVSAAVLARRSAQVPPHIP
jgi:DNA mismatch endonuclease (patch repair protein)